MWGLTAGYVMGGLRNTRSVEIELQTIGIGGAVVLFHLIWEVT